MCSSLIYSLLLWKHHPYFNLLSSGPCFHSTLDVDEWSCRRFPRIPPSTISLSLSELKSHSLPAGLYRQHWPNILKFVGFWELRENISCVFSKGKKNRKKTQTWYHYVKTIFISELLWKSQRKCNAKQGAESNTSQ